MPWVDRLCSWTGARGVVRDRPGMGWMLVEVVPVVVWTRFTGAFSLEGAYYLVTWLMLLGAAERHLAWLPLLFGLGTMGHAWLVIRRRDARGRMTEPRKACLIDTAIGRGLWLLAFLWPLGARALDLDWRWAVGGALALMVLGQAVLLAGASAWSTWIKAIVPERQRGPFFAWRNIAGFVSFGLTTWALTQLGVWPDAAASDDQRLAFYTGLFVVLTIISLLMMWPLAWAPRIDSAIADTSRRTARLRQATRRRPAFWRFAAWNACNIGASFSALTYLRPLLSQAGIADETFATWDGLVRAPALIVAILLSGALIHRVGAGRVMLVVNLLLVAALAAFCAIAWTGPGLLPVAMACDGLARGAIGVAMLTRLHQLIPHADARFPALFMGLGGLGGCVVAGIELPIMPLLERWHAGGGPLSAAWLAVAGAAVLRLLATPLLLGSTAQR